MSAFTNDDLKRLKAIAEKGMVTLSTTPFHVVACAFRPGQLQALIVRLECAEKALRITLDGFGGFVKKDAIDAWQKSKTAGR